MQPPTVQFELVRLVRHAPSQSLRRARASCLQAHRATVPSHSRRPRNASGAGKSEHPLVLQQRTHCQPRRPACINTNPPSRAVSTDTSVDMPLFDRYIAVDWSSNSQPKTGRDSIWSCVGDDRTSELRTANHPTRRAGEAWLLKQLRASVWRDERALVGFDFPYGYPTGFAASLGVEGEAWKGVWAYLDCQIRDDERNLNNRFEVAEAVNRRLGYQAPYWGRPPHLMLPALPFRKEVTYLGPREPNGLPEWRQAEEELHRLRKWPQPVWKLAGAGAVGSQSLVGIPVVRRLREHDALRAISQVWPFEVRVPNLACGVPAIVHAEIWPSIVPFAHEVGSCPDEQQVRAVVDHLRRLDQADQLIDLFLAAPDNSAVRSEEGWVLGVPSPRYNRCSPCD
jgi:precorrin-8X/cobalt-precorrin-8 methylmutase